MNLHIIDIGIIVLYLAATIFIGFYISKRASKDIKNYFLGGNTIPWYYLGVSDASGMFDIAGTMLLVYWLSVYNILGNEVAVLVDGSKAVGTYTISFDALNLPSGVYFYKLETGNNLLVKKMMLLK